jgi:S1-C subfamily serine protease
VPGLAELERAVARVAAAAGPSAVGVGAGWGRGCGTVVAPGRVLASARAARAGATELIFADGSRAAAEPVGVDEALGLAVLGWEGPEAPPVRWVQDVAALGIGRAVVAVANPGGRGVWATLGALASAPHEGPGRGARGGALRLEHTAALPRGAAGSALCDLEGALVGVSVTRLGEGAVLALAATPALRDRVDALGRGEGRATPALGLAVAPAGVARRLRRAVGLPDEEGLLVREVEPGSPAERGGVRQGDLVVAAGGHDVRSVADLRDALDLSGGGTLELGLVRGVERRTALVEVPVP